MTTMITLDGPPRPVRDDVVQHIDTALGALGGEVIHSIDPKRVLGFDLGGPAVWSVGLVQVAAQPCYTLLVTYGFSEIVSPELCRAGIAHEYSLAVPASSPISPWADALLRHLARYILTSSRDLHVGDVMPCYAPITWIPFPPHFHGQMPPTALVGIVVAADPVLPAIATDLGPIEVRRLVGIEQHELDRVETWSASAFIEEYLERDPLLLTDLHRASSMHDPVFATVVDARARHEGSKSPAILVDVAWVATPGHIVLELPGGREAYKLLAALRGRLPFGERLTVISRRSPPIMFHPSDRFGMEWSERGLELAGSLEHGVLAQIVGTIDPAGAGSRVEVPLGT